MALGLCAKPYIGCPYPRPPMPMGFGWEWVRYYCLWVGMGGHVFDIIVHGWAWAKAKHIGRGHWMNSHSMLLSVRAPNHLHPIRWVHPSMCLLLVLLLLLLECVLGLPRILSLFFVTFLCFCFSHPTLNPIPASNSKSESNFSDAGNMLTKKRCRLKPMIVNDFFFVRSNQDLV